jgi:hypothetical protein
VLSAKERVVEIARMLGDPEDPTALMHAEEMIGRRSGGEGGEGDGTAGGAGAAEGPSPG